METLSDEVLGAYIDEALPPGERAAVERAIRERPEIQQRIEALRAADAALRATVQTPPMHGIVDPIAERIRAARPPGPFSRWTASRSVPVLSAAVLAGILGLAVGRLTLPEPTAFAADSTLEHVLDTAPSGQTVDDVRVLLTFKTQAETPCRQFTSYRKGQTGEGLSCRMDGDWRILAWIAAPAGSPAGYHMAGADSAIDGLVDSLDSTGALSAEEEADAMRRHWKAR